MCVCVCVCVSVWGGLRACACACVCVCVRETTDRDQEVLTVGVVQVVPGNVGHHQREGGAEPYRQQEPHEPHQRHQVPLGAAVADAHLAGLDCSK